MQHQGIKMFQRSASLRSFIQTSIARSFASKVEAICSGARTASSKTAASESTFHNDQYNENAPIDWDNLGFSFTPIDYMYMKKFSEDGTSETGHICRYRKIELSPSAGVLNYGQGLFEGMKACRRDDGTIFLFRPEQNAIRMQIGAERMCMQAPTVEQFVDAVKQTARANSRWVPPCGKGSLYMRPMLIGSGPVLGVAPAPEYTFLVYASPVGNYFKEDSTGLNLYVEDEFHRAIPGGAGGVKSLTNYAPVLKALCQAKNKGFSEVLYLDAVNNKYIEEASASNIFLVKGNVISTPAATGTILEGITRKSIMEIAHDLGFKVEERLIAVEELVDAEEIFCTGSAVTVVPVKSITYKGQRIEYKTKIEMVSKKLYSNLVAIQKGHIVDKRGWIVEI